MRIAALAAALLVSLVSIGCEKRVTEARVAFEPTQSLAALSAAATTGDACAAPLN